MNLLNKFLKVNGSSDIQGSFKSIVIVCPQHNNGRTDKKIKFATISIKFVFTLNEIVRPSLAAS